MPLANITPLLALLRACSADERAELARLSDTDTNYLYQLATCRRPNPSATKALAIEDASREMHRRNSNLQIITVRDLATMCVVKPTRRSARVATR